MLAADVESNNVSAALLRSSSFLPFLLTFPTMPTCLLGKRMHWEGGKGRVVVGACDLRRRLRLHSIVARSFLKKKKPIRESLAQKHTQGKSHLCIWLVIEPLFLRVASTYHHHTSLPPRSPIPAISPLHSLLFLDPLITTRPCRSPPPPPLLHRPGAGVRPVPGTAWR